MIHKALRKIPPARWFYNSRIMQRRRVYLNSKKSATKIIKREYHRSYSQCGEDIIVNLLFRALKIEKKEGNLTYLDIGANDPIHMNNTYFFFKKGYRGVCIEPDPVMFEKLERARKRDICLNLGIGVDNGTREADFYVMTANTLNTFSKEDALRFESFGHVKIEKIIRIPLVPINNLLNDYFNTCPDFISFDIEGLELEVLNSFDFETFKPAILCVETLTYANDNTEQKIPEIIDLVESKGYLVFADTYINTIFVDEKRWRNR